MKKEYDALLAWTDEYLDRRKGDRGAAVGLLRKLSNALRNERNKFDVSEALRNGEKIARPHWVPGKYIHFGGVRLADASGITWTAFDLCNMTDWIPYEATIEDGLYWCTSPEYLVDFIGSVKDGECHAYNEADPSPIEFAIKRRKDGTPCKIEEPNDD